MLLVIPLWSQFDFMNYRTIDGRNNNLTHTEWGAAPVRMPRIVPAHYGDGISSPAGATRPNPREISNALFAQKELLAEPIGLSDFTWVFGQFLDHDFALALDNNEEMKITIPAGDPHFDPFGTGKVFLSQKRSQFDPATGTSVSNPREHVNVITSYVDASMCMVRTQNAPIGFVPSREENSRCRRGTTFRSIPSTLNTTARWTPRPHLWPTR